MDQVDTATSVHNRTAEGTSPRLRGLAFFGGGSGGHLFPGLAVAERARRRFPDCRVAFYCPGRSVEKEVFADCPFEVHAMNIRPPGRLGAGWLRYSLAAARAMQEARAVLKEGFDVVLGLGGYASVPGILAARARGLPVILLEQNRVPGKVNRLLAPFASVVSSSHPGTDLRRARRVEFTGNPVRECVTEFSRLRDERVRCDLRRTLLVVGGSQGASGLNRAITAALERLRPWRDKIRWIHVAGSRERDLVARGYRESGWSATVLEFAPNLPELLSQSDLVLTRAGGTTLSEIAVLGLPAVLVPYPHHADRHQFLNAREYVDAGAGCMIEEGDLSAERLEDVIRNLLLVPDRLERMARCARELARPDAADSVVDLAVELRESCRPDFASYC